MLRTPNYVLILQHESTSAFVRSTVVAATTALGSESGILHFSWARACMHMDTETAPARTTVVRRAAITSAVMEVKFAENAFGTFEP